MPSGHPPPSYQQATKDNSNESGGGAFTDDLINFGGHDDVTTTVNVNKQLTKSADICFDFCLFFLQATSSVKSPNQQSQPLTENSLLSDFDSLGASGMKM